jgi:hypothetical protein
MAAEELVPYRRELTSKGVRRSRSPLGAVQGSKLRLPVLALNKSSSWEEAERVSSLLEVQGL